MITGCLLLLAGCSGGSTPPPLSTTIAAAPAVSVPSAAAAPPSVSNSQSVAPTGVSPAVPPDGATAPAALGDLRITTVATGLEVPWGLGFLPDGTAVITGRDDASVSTIAPDGTVTGVGTIGGVEPAGEGGLLGVAVSPNFAQDNLLYVYYSAADDNRIDTVTLRDGAIGNQQTGFTGIPKGNIHNGGRLAFGPDGLLYVGTGETGERPTAQDPNSLGGKILRMTPEFQPAPGNPGGGVVYSTGHRNVQGLAFDDGAHLWAAEFGQNTWDELNLIAAGGNYGWPEVEGFGAADGFVDPQRVWPTNEASPSGIAYWRGSIWLAGLRGQQLWQIPLLPGDGGADGQLTDTPIPHLTGAYGRLRTVVVAPDGSLWLTTSNTDGRGDLRAGDDRILRLQPT